MAIIINMAGGGTAGALGLGAQAQPRYTAEHVSFGQSEPLWYT